MDNSHSLTLVSLFARARHMMRIELLSLLEVKEIVVLALVCKQMKKLIDPYAGHQPQDNQRLEGHFSYICALQFFNFELKKNTDFEVSLTNTVEPIWLLKDLVRSLDYIIHESYNGNGFCYRRYNKELKKHEQLASTGNYGAWTDNP